MLKKKPKSIRWKDANKVKPKLHPARWLPYDHSNRVLLWVIGHRTNKAQDCACFGTWSEFHGWYIEGRTGHWEVTHWAYINTPVKRAKRKMVKCTACNGKGDIRLYSSTGIGYMQPCTVCDGKGKF